MRIRIALALAATAAPLLHAGCGQGAASPSAEVAPIRVTQVLPLDQLWVLETSGIAPSDSSVSFAAAEARTIILRHGAPDNTVFVELVFPESVFVGAGAPESVTVDVHPRPGIYGVDVALSSRLAREGARITFKYPVHFSAPVEALQRYGTATRFERNLSVAMLAEDQRYALLASERPASDNLSAPLPGPGTYLVAAPR